jgi:beta-lactam-binding protein with PASTA domain
VGRPARTAALDLEREGFAPGDEARVHVRSLLAGTVVAQVPPAGTPAVPGSRVHRLVSMGPAPPLWVMPDLTGLPLGRVETWATSSGFRLAPVRRIAAGTGQAGRVIGQLPAAGHPVASKAVLEITVDAGGI